MPKGDSSKRKKADKDGSSNKKQKGDKNQQQQVQQQQQRQGSITSASTEITMTIPRKKDNKNKAAAAAANNESSTFSLPKIPKKSDKQQQQPKSLSPPVDIMMGTIPKKKTDKRSSVGSLDSMTIPKKSNKSSNNNNSNSKSEKHTIKADNKPSSSSSSSNNTSNKTTTTEKATVSNNKKEGSNSGVDSSSSKKDKEKITTAATATPSTKDSRTNETVSASKITPKKSSGNKAGKTGLQQQQQQQQPQKPRGRGRPPSALKLKIDTSIVGGSTTGDHSSSTKGGGSNKPPMTPSSGTAMDSHPFARGSVIEVLHGVFKDPSGDSWWSDDSDEEEAKKEEEEKNKSKQSVRLCDVIDRVATDAEKNHWRYYVHYRDFNRRMDEWIPMERIVSPPSVGNAKARALKKEEERQKRKQQRLEEKKAELQSGVNVSGPRASRRRSTVVNNQQQPGGVGSGGAVTGTGGGTAGGADPSAVTAGGANTPIGADGETDTPRRTRLRRRSVDDDATVVASNQGGGGGGDKSSSRGGDVGVGGGSDGSGPPPQVVMAAEKGVVAIQTQAATHTTVGEHVVATIPAQELDEHEGLDEASLREHEEVTKVKNVEFLELGAYQMETWYFSPLPKELLNEKGLIDVLYVCEFTFNMFSRKNELRRFQSRLKPHMRHPPGNEIYRNGNIAMFEVDGFEQRIYCQNLCYIAKLFLDHKTLYFDVDPFLFYVLCEVDKRGFHPVGYYSKEKYSDVGYGYGRFLIAFSYELSKKEEKVGSPEKPMSDLGQQAYKPYWASTIVDFLLNQSPDSSSMSIMDISKQTSIMAEDIVFTLNQLGILKIINGVYFIAAEVGLLRTLAKKYPVKKPIVDPSKLHWTPFITDVKRDKFSIHSKKASVDSGETRGDKNDATTKQ